MKKVLIILVFAVSFLVSCEKEKDFKPSNIEYNLIYGTHEVKILHSDSENFIFYYNGNIVKAEQSNEIKEENKYYIIDFSTLDYIILN